MDQQPLRNPPPRPALAAPARAHWTPARQRIFLAALHDSGSVAFAAKAAGMSRGSAYRLRARLPNTQFDRTWTQALELHARRFANPLSLETPSAPQ